MNFLFRIRVWKVEQVADERFPCKGGMHRCQIGLVDYPALPKIAFLDKRFNTLITYLSQAEAQQSENIVLYLFIFSSSLPLSCKTCMFSPHFQIIF